MLIKLNDFEKEAVGGSLSLGNFKCYDEDGNAVRGFDADNWQDANWFCCSGDIGNNTHMVYEKEYKNCETGARKTLPVRIPDNIKEYL